MQEVIVLKGGIHYYHDKEGNPKDFFNVNPHEQAHFLQCLGHPLHILGQFPNVDLLSIIREIKVKDNNVVACFEETTVQA